MIAAAMNGPYIDVAALSPLIALGGGALIVLLTGLLRPRFIRETVVPLFAFIALPPRWACRSGSGTSPRRSSPTRCASISCRSA